MNILLCYPRYPDTFWSFRHALKFIRRKAAHPPLGLLTVSSMLPKNWKKRLIDLNVRELKEEDIAWADMIFISAMLVQLESAKEIVRRCRGKTIVAGGSCFIDQKIKGISHYVLDEAEITLPRYLKDLRYDKAKKTYRSKIKPDIKQTKKPDWSIIRFKDYATMALQYSRGCPFDCEFCNIVSMFGRRSRTKSTRQFVAELDSLYLAGWRGSVFIVDDNFIGNKSVVKLLPAIISWQKKHRYPFSFLTEASTNLADNKALMQLMSQANFSKVFLGIETPCIESLSECGKLQNKRDIVETVRIIHSNGMQVMGGFIVGFDTDNENIFQAQIDFIQKIGVVTAMVGVLNALPHTRLWQRMKSEGRLIDVVAGDNTDTILNFIPKMGAQKLIKGYKELVSSIYSPKQYYKRINTFIKSYKPTIRQRIQWQDLYALFRSTWRIGIFSRSNHRFWRLLARTSFTKFRALPIAIELAILGQHYQMVAKRIHET